MNVKEAIEKRRSIRKYDDKEVTEEVLRELIDAARLAPSGNNAQPWYFKIVTSAEDKKKLKDSNMYPQDFVYTAPVLIICCADPSVYPAGEFIKGMDHPNQVRAIRDLSLACENLVLRAVELGLGTCYIGWMDKEKVKDLLDIPKDYIVPYTITVGYPAGGAGEPKKKSADDILL